MAAPINEEDDDIITFTPNDWRDYTDGPEKAADEIEVDPDNGDYFNGDYD